MPRGARALSLDVAIARLGACQGLVVASDFDGTLAPIVDRPDEAMADRRALARLAGLARHEGVVVAVVSGRAFSELRSLLGELPGVVLIGEHGNDRGEANRTEDERVHEMADFVRAVADTLPGSAVEVKRQGVGFHYRQAADDAAAKAVSSIVSWAEGHPEVKVTRGKEVVELSVALHHKGDAVLGLKEEAGADCVVFIGDDTTDESVFTVLGPEDIGIKVGPGETAARYRVEDVSEVVRVLEAIERALA